MVDTRKCGAYWPTVTRDLRVPAAATTLKFNPTTSTIEQHMGSTIFGNASPARVGSAMPRRSKFDRDGSGRVRVSGPRTS